jgi:ATP-binding cassette subfamily A (ABC1) protein 3
MNALKITRFEHHAHKGLSGGTKRKLTVAIALLGNPRLLLLDEPSTGQDAGAKRLLWRALKRVSKDRAILLTTHSMEEAEALASKAVIVSTRMLAIGSLSSLQELHGGLYKIRAVRSESAIKSVAETQVRVTLGQQGIEVQDYWDSNGLVQFNVVYDRTTLGRIMVAMARLVGHSDIISGLRTQLSPGK